MDKDELITRLQRYEWNDVEFKRAQRGVSEEAYVTVSAFSNTAGGWLVFGVKDASGHLEIVGVIDVDKVQNDFLSCLRTTDKLSCPIDAKEDMIEHDGKTLLVFYIPEARRRDKPVYLNGDIRRSFIRRGGGDERCTPEEIERFLRDASDRRYDNELIEELDAEDFFDSASVAWYRRLFDERNPGRQEALTDIEFLNEWGFVIEVGDRLIPTRAAVLLFGQGRYVRQLLPRAVVDYQRIDNNFEQWSPDTRWHDRVVVEENITQAWLTLVERYMSQAERSFDIDAASMRRHDVPPDYISFREAAINLLIHQDYGDHTRKPVIKFFRDRTVFWNPGDSFATTDQLLDPVEKEVRNPAIVSAFRRIGLSDQAGTGVRAIFNNWQRLGNVPPILRNGKEDKTFELILLKEELLSEEQLLFQAQLGVHLNELQAKLFAYTCRSGQVTITDAKAVSGLNGPEARRLLESLEVQVLLQPVEPGWRYALAEHLKDRFMPSGNQDLVTDQVAFGTQTWSVLARLRQVQRVTKLAANNGTWSLTKSGP
jgi:ATP-dependent DNA helicase RecG